MSGRTTSAGDQVRGTHAVVLGGSVAGLVAARVLADHFERVTVLERDRYPQGPAARKGTPQARHAHVLLARGQQVLNALFPGIVDEIADAGAPLLDAAGDVARWTPLGWVKPFTSGIAVLSASRDLLEWSVRRRVASIPNVTFVEGVDVVGLLPDAAGTGVAGVSICPRHEESATPRRLDADLVIDASGRGSRVCDWLRELGYQAPEETVVDSRLGYASRVYRRPANFAGNWEALVVRSAPISDGRGGMIQSVEGDRWVVTLSGCAEMAPPTDEAGFLEFARTFSHPALYEAIRDAEPLTPVSGFRGTANRRRHFERLARLPERLVVLGDAACAFNPVYGQGMTVAVLGAAALGECLCERGGSLVGLSRRFQKRLAAVTSTPWQMATAEDFRLPLTEGRRPGWLAGLRQKYLDRLLIAAVTNVPVRRVLLEVTHLLRGPQALFTPAMMLRAMGVRQPEALSGRARRVPVTVARPTCSVAGSAR